MSDQNKALLIQHSSTSKTGKRGEWHVFEEAQPYIQGIVTHIDKDVNAEVMTSLVTGIPTPWARARLFGFAFPYTQVEANIKKSGLVEFYERLVEEWKGLLAVLAIFPDRIRIGEPVVMNEKDRRFHIPADMGRMLFEDKDLWTNPVALKSDPDTAPSIQLIYYQGQLIGATSPYSLLFTAVDYSNLSQTSEIDWYRNGAFVDPLPFLENNSDRLQKLYLLIKNINDHFEDFEKVVNVNRGDKVILNFQGLKDFLRGWQQQIREMDRKLLEEGTLDAELAFQEPFAPLFKVKQTLYFYQNGNISFKLRPRETSTEVDPQEILLQENYLGQIMEEDEQQPLSRSAIHFLSVPNDAYRPGKDNGEPEFFYFLLPLSEKGLRLFRNQIADLITGKQATRHEIRAAIRSSDTDYKLRVELHLSIDDKKMLLTQRDYEPVAIETGRRVIMWPNFISSKWESYFLYSEFPQAERGTKIRPFFKEAGGEGKAFILDAKERLVFSDTAPASGLVSVEKLVTYPGGLDSSAHRYDVIRANKPFGGMEIRQNIEGEEKLIGYMVIKSSDDDSMGDRRVKDLSQETNYTDVIIGIDFGSNNSCIQYAREDGSDVAAVPFENRRVMLLSSEVIDPTQQKIAMPHELYFFQNDPPKNGQIKSWVHEHRPRYIEDGMEDEEISGGVPIFEPNIHIREMNNRTITTNAGTLHHSMKWLDDADGKLKKTAYLKGVFLKICADLHARQMHPKELRWSFPGSFTALEENQYGLIYKDVVKKNPIEGVHTQVGQEPLTESEAVSNFAISKLAPDDYRINLGIDVGGSTSDVLLIAKDFALKQNRLIKQSSLRLAAGQLSGAAISSRMFRKTLVDFHNNPKSRINIPHIDQIDHKNAPYYLNAIFDRLDQNSFPTFYSFLGMRMPKLFALPAYMTGLLIYYSGQLIAKAQKEHDYLLGVTEVSFFPFGKGGRIFDWLDEFPGERIASAYYLKCFKAGYGDLNTPLTLKKIGEDTIRGIRADNKSEVAKGLVSAASAKRVVRDQGLRDESDIFGESGFEIREGSGENQLIGKEVTIQTSHFDDLDQLKFPRVFEEFNTFLQIFLDFAGPSQSGILPDTRGLKSKSEDLSRHLRTFIEQDPEYKKAKTAGVFGYKHSMLMLEGCCFLEKFLIPDIYED